MRLKVRNPIVMDLDSLRGSFLVDDVDLLGQFYSRLYNCSIAHRLKLLLFALVFKARLSGGEAGEGADVYAIAGSYVNRRPDTLEMWKNVVSCISQLQCAQLLIGQRFDLLGVLKKVIRSMHFFTRLRSKNLKLFDRLLVAILLSKGERDADYLNSWACSVRGTCKCVLTFCDAIGIENAIAQTARNHDICSVTIQHGQYRQSGGNIPSPDDEAYKNFVSDYLLCWGQATVDELTKVGIGKERFFSSGRFLNRSNPKPKAANQPDRFGVVLSGENSPEKNTHLLVFASQLANFLNKQYLVRLHPSSRASDYSGKVCEKCVQVSHFSDNESYYGLVKFSVLMTTGLYLDFVIDRHSFVFFDDGTLPNVFLRSGIVVREESEVRPRLYLLTDEKFSDLASLYDDSYNQRLRVEKFFWDLCKD